MHRARIMRVMQRTWKYAPTCPADALAETADLSPVSRQLLWNRGICLSEDVQRFLSPSWEEHVHDPFAFRDMRVAVEKLFSFVEAGQRITVHGDYDADGVTGSTVLISTLRELEKRLRMKRGETQIVGGESEVSCVDFYIPHRDKEGYGLRTATIQILADRGTKLIVTVDCGIACVEEIALAKTHGIETIVVDHHQFGEELPKGTLIHPGLDGETYPHKTLAAVGVAFKLACALMTEARVRGLDVPVGFEKWLLDLVSIATVTDMVPLLGENRVLEHFGLKVLNKTRRPGLRALIVAAGLEDKVLDAESVGFTIGPRLNAAGRMEHASLALNLLLSSNEEEATRLAQELEACNRRRQDATRRMMEEAERQLAERDISLEKIVILWHEEWSPSLVGLIAGKMMEKTTRPVVVVGHHAGAWIGSGRSMAAYDITSAVREAGGELLARVGGHVQACGFALKDQDGLLPLADRLREHASAHLSPEDLSPVLAIDLELPLEDCSRATLDAIVRLAPFGQANPRPVFASRRALVQKCDRMGARQQHLRLQVASPSGLPVKAVAFNVPIDQWNFVRGNVVDLAYHLDVNEWNGRSEIQLKLLDVKEVA